MKGNAQVVQTLNDILVGELTAINQYFLGAKIAGHRGYERLAHKVYKESLDEMRHAEKLIDRILFLEGLPNLQKLEKVTVAESVIDQLRADLESEARSVERLNAGIKLSRGAGDHGSADLLEELLESSEKHLEWLETQVGLVKHLGDTHYLAQQLKKDG
jgi:bacterioferritin